MIDRAKLMNALWDEYPIGLFSSWIKSFPEVLSSFSFYKTMANHTYVNQLSIDIQRKYQSKETKK